MVWKVARVPGCCTGIIIGDLGGVHGHPRLTNDLWAFLYEGVKGFVRDLDYNFDAMAVNFGRSKATWSVALNTMFNGRNIIVTLSSYAQDPEIKLLTSLGFTFTPYYGNIVVGTISGLSLYNHLAREYRNKMNEHIPELPKRKFPNKSTVILKYNPINLTWIKEGEQVRATVISSDFGESILTVVIDQRDLHKLAANYKYMSKSNAGGLISTNDAIYIPSNYVEKVA